MIRHLYCQTLNDRSTNRSEQGPFLERKDSNDMLINTKNIHQAEHKGCRQREGGDHYAQKSQRHMNREEIITKEYILLSIKKKR